MESTIYPLAARTATPTSVDVPVGRARGLLLVIDITAGVTLAVTPKIEGVDTLSGKTFTLLVGTALAGVGTTVLRVFPAAPAAANAVANDVLPETIRITMTHGNANSATYTVAAHLLRGL